VIGLVQVGIQAMADRYTYVPLIGLFIIASWGGYDLASNWRWPAWLRWGTPAVLLGLCASLTVVQVRYWRDNFSLFQHAVSLDPENLLAQHNLGISYADIGDYTSAVEHLAAAIKIAPTYGTLYSDMGWYQARLGKYADAIESFRTALKMGAPEGPARWGLAVALAEQGQLSEAETEIVAGLQLTPVSWEAHDEYGMILIRMGRPEEALGQFLQAAKLEPGSPSARLHAAKVLERLGRFSEAVVQYRQILATDPETVEALNALAWMLATSPDRAVRNGAESVRLAEQACRLTQDRVPEILGTLGAAYAESGRFDDATAAAERAAKVAASLGKQELAGKYEELAQLFRTHQALHEPVSQNNHASHATDSDAGFRR
jgi:tetratricopeptide (TPR) repeat protein